MIELVQMPRERFLAYRENLVRDYAKDKVRAGVWSPDEASLRAEADVDGLLTDGTATEGHTVPVYWCHNASTASTHQEYPVSRLRRAGSSQ